MSSGGSKGGCEGRPPPKFFQFHAVVGNIWQNRMLAPTPGELAPQPGGFARFAVFLQKYFEFHILWSLSSVDFFLSQ